MSKVSEFHDERHDLKCQLGDDKHYTLTEADDVINGGD